ncbi:hypothetical protein HPP92_015859 [Vanilla planifolia]|uniref:FLZ-type domain-containing protein n=1 Tax=Vanilla planifolia TaxID=51239 RepID=A0A835QH12_VANPL|nr:hypothetical protein HPP92_015859 [Vanilla planifolia]
MLSGKLLRSPMKRTTSQRELPPDVVAVGDQTQMAPLSGTAEGRGDGRTLHVPQRSMKRRYLSDHAASHFLKTCGLCNRNLGPGLDIFMYRGEFAFCSVECREKQMMEDEKKERKKCSLSSVKKAEPPPSSRGCESSPSSETVGAGPLDRCGDLRSFSRLLAVGTKKSIQSRYVD